MSRAFAQWMAAILKNPEDPWLYAAAVNPGILFLPHPDTEVRKMSTTQAPQQERSQGDPGPLTPYGEQMVKEAIERYNKNLEEVTTRRQLAGELIEDMQRLLHGWRNNKLTVLTSITGEPIQQKLTVTLNEEQITALTREFMRLRSVVQAVTNSVQDWEIGMRPDAKIVGMVAAEGPSYLNPRPKL